ncbi:MAG: sortase [Acidimicrobiia bacterium]
MTAVTAALGRRRKARTATPGVAVPPLAPGLQLVRAVLVAVLVVSATLVIEMLLVSSLQQRSAQQRLFDRFRAELAAGTAPVGPTLVNGDVVKLGAPVAYLEIPAIGVRQVVVEGTAGGQLLDGPGHRRDTPLPGQAGTSIVMGRRASFGGPFAHIDELERGDVIRVTTGQGEVEYRVMGVRHEGDDAPAPPASDEGRLVLVTADGRPFVPSGVLRVDAEIRGQVDPGPAPGAAPATLPAAERIMASDTGTLWSLVLWLQVLIAVSVGAVWAWHRWGRAKAWLVFLPPLVLVGLLASSEAARLMPNLL